MVSDDLESLLLEWALKIISLEDVAEELPAGPAREQALNEATRIRMQLETLLSLHLSTSAPL